jgi:micrococcal nuclease
MPRRTFALLLLATAVVAAACSHASSKAAGQPRGGATVERVVDGDTIIARISGRRERVRFIGMDTPESVKPNTPVQCFAIEASNRTKALLPAGTPIRLVGDVEQRDKYKRLLAYVYRAKDNLFVNLSLVRDGYAQPYTFPPNVAHTGEFVAAAADARQAGRGLWSACR